MSGYTSSAERPVRVARAMNALLPRRACAAAQ
jgi:hypothetical protein